ncbi:MAG: beta-ketoacyl synthase N-terminal-like domain-containing protein [Acidobacteriota bacterium]|nr:beta-ketoacyl synthase N-terminal-like domain-containing protein [Acidobacteriota bacterium]
MRKIRKPVYFACGDYTVSLGTGRKEFHPKKPRPGLEHYIAEAGRGVLAQLGGADKVDESVVGNFMAARFNKQGHLGALISVVDPGLTYKPSLRVEGACASGGLALATAVRSVLADQADGVLALGVEVQNTVKAIYGADVLAGAGHFASERKQGHAYFFPSRFAERAGAYQQRFGHEQAWEGMGRWYEQAILAARTNDKAQEFHNADPDPFASHQRMRPNPPGLLRPHQRAGLLEGFRRSGGRRRALGGGTEPGRRGGRGRHRAGGHRPRGRRPDCAPRGPHRARHHPPGGQRGDGNGRRHGPADRRLRSARLLYHHRHPGGRGPGSGAPR